MRNIILISAIAFLAGSPVSDPAAALDRPPPRGGPVGPGDAAICGGIAGLHCGADEWCDYRRACGAGDRTGTCRPRPEACAQIYQPVCGCDGKTHGNACSARSAGTDVAYQGACRSGG